ncbi:hypothetical protein MTO96_004240 [Rhipicephalus appendiculatus]
MAIGPGVPSLPTRGRLLASIFLADDRGMRTFHGVLSCCFVANDEAGRRIPYVTGSRRARKQADRDVSVSSLLYETPKFFDARAQDRRSRFAGYPILHRHPLLLVVVSFTGGEKLSGGQSPFVARIWV